MSFKLDFQGHLSRFLRGRGLDVYRITSYWIDDGVEENPSIVVTFTTSDGAEDAAILPGDLEALIEAL